MNEEVELKIGAGHRVRMAYADHLRRQAIYEALYGPLVGRPPTMEEARRLAREVGREERPPDTPVVKEAAPKNRAERRAAKRRARRSK